jgi:transcriptional regulator with XRE-family HTH domain
MTAIEPSAFGILLRQCRIKAGLTQKELAERARVSARVVSDLERGVTQTPRQYTVRQLADALELIEEERNRFTEPAQRQPAPLLAPPKATAGAERSGRIQTFLVADIRKYTAFTHEHGDAAAARLAAAFATIGQAVVEAHSGEVVELRGDELLAAFSSARGAACCGDATTTVPTRS